MVIWDEIIRPRSRLIMIDLQKYYAGEALPLMPLA